MSNQPYGYEGHQGHQGYDAYQEPQAEPHQYAAQPQAQPHWQGYDESQAAHAQQYTQQWEGQTWETQIQPQTPPGTPPAADVAETAYLPPQTGGPNAQYGQGGQYGQGAQHGANAQHDPNAQYGQYAPQGGPQPQPPQPQPSSRPPADPVPQSGPGYGPPTLTGNTRVTDAQRARAEGRSPIIEPGMQPALLTAVLGLLLAGAAAIGEYALAVPLVILQAVTAAGWFRLNGMWPARQGIVLAFAGALAADTALFAAGREHAPAAILGTLGVWVLLSIVLGLRSHADPDERMYGLMATVTSAALSIIATGYLAAVADAVTVGGVAVAVAVLARALPLPTPASVIVSLLAATGAGIAVGGATDLGTSGALLGAAAALCALVGHRVAAYDYPSRFVHFTAGVALPLAAAAPAVYLLGRALG
ncbi:hypothetical protein [Streptomyces europaeiscabiei]|uniref:hypothetical protein n=1 Tax=Streptomyces europaeiscabiei TaxID=146819 RepID=UPI0029AEF83C|nr:hypothetical protein [Streptomyces europaeiscabiei]MDX3783115.1 hypothetical protein [Streptomyces europaeiscabiei]MDX3847513.1 hypothetical protein [Streptomyces europaeiscabiei]